MNEFGVIGDIVLKDKIIYDGFILVEGGIIKSICEKSKDINFSGKILDFSEKYIAPGFVDIHCHAGGDVWAFEDPVKMAEYHKSFGTTTLICTLYRDISHKDILNAISKIKEAMSKVNNIAGVHMEGPYLNPEYGAGDATFEKIKTEEYLQIAKSGIIKQWTFSPEMPGTDEFLKDIVPFGIVPAIGHSNASPEKVKGAVKGGVKIITHLYNATGSSETPVSTKGVKVISFDQAALLCDNLYYEIICDKDEVHVKPDLIKLAIKTVGIERIVGITDACKGGEGDSDINIVNGQLMGSKLNMLKVAKNFSSLGLNIVDVMKVTALNPAAAVGMDNEVGSIEIGKTANLIALAKTFSDVSVVSSF